jgi:adenylosuccinate lyase
MISRYTLPEMASVWSENNKFQKWLDIEILAVEARVERGEVPAEALQEIKARAAFDAGRIREIEDRVHHDVIAFLTNVAENVGESSRFIHYGMTSSDILDTGLALQMREAMDLIIAEARALCQTLKERALQFRDLAMVGRTHGVHAEPIVLGQKLALWTFEMLRNLIRLRRAREVINYGKISGAVGTYAHLDPAVEGYVCRKLGLTPAEVSTQILQRDRHAEYLTAIAVAGSSLDKFALEIRSLQRTEVLEVEEPFARGQKGSSAMPHKRNPIICERICGLARILRANAIAAMENMPLWHERDISHSSVERVIIPDSTTLLHYMLVKFRGVIEGMQVYPENMRRNLELTHGLIYSEGVMLALVDKGLSREEAYALVQRRAMESWRTGEELRSLLAADAEVTAHLSPEDLDRCFDLESQTRRLEKVFNSLQSLEV